ncbi:MAG: hypothetical protein SPK09_04085 [Porphyromonas sp.]|nr:hypothetical protein [Porphyromonas sp.]
MAKKSASIGNYSIAQLDSGTIEVRRLSDNSLCDNTIEALREIAQSIGFRYDSDWNTRTFGSKLIDAIIDGVSPKSSAFIRVHGRAQNRAALGVMHAYLKINPQASLEDLRRAFPNALNPDRGVDEIFIKAEEKGASANWDGFFKEPAELLTLANGAQISVVKMWTKPSLGRLIEKAKEYGIELADLDVVDKDQCKVGGFYLEYLNGWTPPTPAPAPAPTPAPTVEVKPSKWKTWYTIAFILIAVVSLVVAYLIINQ